MRWNDNWYVEHVSVEHHDEFKFHFRLSRWIPADTSIKFNKFDSHLPEFVMRTDPDHYKQRAAELEQNKKDFANGLVDGIKGMPRSVTS